jgi:hypothetical protein
MPITTVANCKAFRGVEAANQEHDAELERIIPAVQAFLEQECGRVFDQAEVTEYFDGEMWASVLLVARPPINSIINLWDDPTRVFATPFSVGSYDVKDANAGIVRLLDDLEFSDGQHNIKITYSGGYTSMPFDLSNARRIWYWAGAASLSQLAVTGTSKPGECKFPVAVPRVELLEAIEILDVTPEAWASIGGVPEWRN